MPSSKVQTEMQITENLEKLKVFERKSFLISASYPNVHIEIGFCRINYSTKMVIVNGNLIGY